MPRIIKRRRLDPSSSNSDHARSNLSELLSSSDDSDSSEDEENLGNTGSEAQQSLPVDVVQILQQFSSQAAVQSVNDGNLRVMDQLVNTSISTPSAEQIFNEVMRAVQNDVSRSTLKTYKGPMQQYLVWCNQQTFPDMTRQLVSEQKVLAFIHTEVVNRGDLRANQTRSRVGLKTVQNAVSALVHLWQHQKNLNANNFPHPRGSAVKSYLRYLKRQENEKNRSEFKDRAIGTVADGYTNDAQLQQLVDVLFDQQFQFGPALRMRSMILLSHFGMLRGQSVRAFEFADLTMVEDNGNGGRKVVALILLINNGKTNYVNRQEYAQMTRASNVNICPVSSLAVYLFYRFNVSQCLFPDLSIPEEWFQHKIFPSSFRQPESELSYNAHRDMMKKVISLSGISASKVTHLTRKCAVNSAQAQEIDSGRLAAQGRWSSDALSKCYMSVQWDNLVKLAGFSRKSLYVIHRASITPSQELQMLIYPQLNSYLHLLEDNNQTLTTKLFIKTMLYLRIVLLQDAALLMESYPYLSLWNEPVFQTDQFRQFSQQVKAACLDAELSGSELLDRLAPELQRVTQSNFEELKSQLNSQSAMLQSLNNSLMQSQNTISDVLQGRTAIRLNVDQGTSSAGQPAPNGGNNAEDDDAEVLDYKMNRSVVTVNTLWQEWTSGIAGGPAVQDLEATFGTKWRKDQTESKFFNRRRVIIDEIKRMVNDNVASCEQEAVRLLEIKRSSNLWSLDKLMKSIKSPHWSL
ncbi:hypothetical protein MP228_000450 [Amoeboaphelidium protococcarum]|nr:hypothetical protein MP228_000450 [Amoeboaphelidium protococcarum]